MHQLPIIFPKNTFIFINKFVSLLQIAIKESPEDIQAGEYYMSHIDDSFEIEGFLPKNKIYTDKPNKVAVETYNNGKNSISNSQIFPEHVNNNEIHFL